MGADIFVFELRNNSDNMVVANIKALNATGTLRTIKSITGVSDCKIVRRGKSDVWDVVSSRGSLWLHLIRTQRIKVTLN